MKPLTMSVIAGAIAFTGTAAAYGQSADFPSITGTEAIPRLPNVFKDCWEPWPAHCVRPPGVLWFGSAATLQRERTAGSRRSRRVRTAHAR